MSFTYNAPTALGGSVVPPLTVDLSWVAATPIAAAPPALLLHMDGTNGSTSFPDSSLNAFTMTSIGGLSLVDTSNPKFGTGALFSPSTSSAPPASGIVSSAIASGSPLDILSGTADFTVECFFNLKTGTSGIALLFDIESSQLFSDTHGLALSVDTAVGLFQTQTGVPTWSAAGTASGTTITQNAWHHAALTRQGGLGKVWLDGVQIGVAATFTGYGGPATTSAFNVGGSSRFSNNNTANGLLIDEVRVTPGVAIYTGAFAPPVAAFPNPGSPSPPPGYDLYRNGISVATYLGSPARADTVSVIGTYVYTVAAWDGTADISAQSAPVSVTFAAGVPTDPLSAKFIPSPVFKAIMLTNPGDINPRIYPQEVDSTARVTPPRIRT